MNKAKSLRFHPPSDLYQRSYSTQIKEGLEQVEILFWQAFITLVSAWRSTSQETQVRDWHSVGKQNRARWQFYFIFSMGSLLSGFLLGLLFGNLF